MCGTDGQMANVTHSLLVHMTASIQNITLQIQIGSQNAIKNTIAIVHTMAGMYGMHKLYVHYLEHSICALFRTQYMCII